MLLALVGEIGAACAPDDDESDSSSGSDDDDADAICDVISEQEYECLLQCEAEFEECHAECVYLPPVEEGSCKDACAATLRACKDDCDDAYEDIGCPDEGNSPADNPTVDDDDDGQGDDDAEA